MESQSRRDFRSLRACLIFGVLPTLFSEAVRAVHASFSRETDHISFFSAEHEKKRGDERTLKISGGAKL